MVKATEYRRKVPTSNEAERCHGIKCENRRFDIKKTIN